jgi:hypothetical protein
MERRLRARSKLVEQHPDASSDVSRSTNACISGVVANTCGPSGRPAAIAGSMCRLQPAVAPKLCAACAQRGAIQPIHPGGCTQRPDGVSMTCSPSRKANNCPSSWAW